MQRSNIFHKVQAEVFKDEFIVALSLCVQFKVKFTKLKSIFKITLIQE